MVIPIFVKDLANAYIITKSCMKVDGLVVSTVQEVDFLTLEIRSDRSYSMEFGITKALILKDFSQSRAEQLSIIISILDFICSI